jgi:hypothetical protein
VLAGRPVREILNELAAMQLAFQLYKNERKEKKNNIIMHADHIKRFLCRYHSSL